MFLRRSAPFGAPDGPTAITGTVTDAATGAPLLNVRLQFYTASGGYAGFTHSDASGGDTLAGLAAGTYLVRTYNAFPYLDEVYNDRPCPGGGCSTSAGTGVSVTTGATTSGINFGLALGGTITGVVTDAGIGAPLANLLVLTYAASDPHGSCVWAVRCSDHPAVGSPIRGVLFTC